MIRTQELIPEVYYKESRDFQLFGRFYDVIYNYVKTNVDLIRTFPINKHTDTRLIELLVRTLGFENKQDYRVDDLNAIASIFVTLIRNKGSLNSIKMLIRTILNVQGIDKTFNVSTSKEGAITILHIILPDFISNQEVKLLEDVLDYILPINTIYEIKNSTYIELEQEEIKYSQYAQVNVASKENNYTNIGITNGKEIELTYKNSSEETIGKEDIQPQKVGNIKYTKVIGKKEKDEE